MINLSSIYLINETITNYGGACRQCCERMTQTVNDFVAQYVSSVGTAYIMIAFLTLLSSLTFLFYFMRYKEHMQNHERIIYMIAIGLNFIAIVGLAYIYLMRYSYGR